MKSQQEMIQELMLAGFHIEYVPMVRMYYDTERNNIAPYPYSIVNTYELKSIEEIYSMYKRRSMLYKRKEELKNEK
jgi:hypothetical protein